MQQIKPVDTRPKVPNKHLVMPVMLLRQVGPEIIPRVDGGGLDKHQAEEDPKRDDMRAQQHRGEDDGDDVRDDVFDRVRILGSQRTRRREPVMDLVDIRIQALGVEKPVRVVEQSLSYEEREQQIPDHDGYRRKLDGHVEGVRSTSSLSPVNENELNKGRHQIVP